MADMTDDSRNSDTHQKERDVLFFNEAFVIGVLQAVSGGSLFAALAQTGNISTRCGMSRAG